MKKIIMLVGNIGSGKSTLAKKLQKDGAVIISRDGLRYSIGGGKYVFNYDYEPAIWQTELYMLNKFMELGVKTIVIDEVGLTEIMRKRYIRSAKFHHYQIEAWVLPKLSMKESVDRRMKDPHGQPDRKLWEQIWTKFDTMFEYPSSDEGIDRILEV